jgi:hypothetical protein
MANFNLSDYGDFSIAYAYGRKGEFFVGCRRGAFASKSDPHRRSNQRRWPYGALALEQAIAVIEEYRGEVLI